MKFDSFVSALDRHGKPQFAILVDPDKYNPELIKAAKGGAGCFLLGGSTLEGGDLAAVARSIRRLSDIPLILFPGDETQLTKHADGLFLPVLISGRNPDYLIGKQVLMAPQIRQLKLPHLAMGYMLVGGDRRSATERVTRTEPIAQADITTILHTVMAGEQMGLGAIYLEAGSGASSVVASKVISAVRRITTLPLIVGGGIDSAKKARAAADAGADLVVVGNALEKNVHLLADLRSVFS